MRVETHIRFAETSEDHTVIQVLGRGTLAQSQAFEQFVRQQYTASDCRAVCVDLRECEYLDSTFLGCLLKLHKLFRSDSAQRFQIAACSVTCERLLRACRLDEILMIRDSAPDVETDWRTVDLTEASQETDALGRHVMQCHGELAATHSPLAAAHRRIAEQLGKELSDKPRESAD